MQQHVEEAGGSAVVAPVEPYALSPKETAEVERIGLWEVYRRLRTGEYQAVKDGKFTKIIYESIKRRRSQLPAARFSPPYQRPRRRNGAAATA
jgi:hypothetical protein